MASNEKSHQSTLTSKLNVPLLSHVLLFSFGLSIGFMLCFYELKTLSFLPNTFFSTNFSASPPPPVITSLSLEETGKRSLWHTMSDDELFRKGAMMGEIEEYLPKGYVPKVAFMFLTRGHIGFAPLWELFFNGHKGLYSIYIHARPGYRDPFPDDSIFHGRFIPTQVVRWGSITMVDAERRLLANALLDFSNQRFVLISEACVPIFNFTMVYNYLINSNQSFLNSFDDPGPGGRGRYNEKMSPNINATDWRKGSQWFEVHRDLAVQIVSDTKYYDLFRNYCIPGRPTSCYNDEHYLPTLANIKFPGLIANRSITYTDWTKGTGAHPAKYEGEDITEEFIRSVRFGSNCSYNGNETHTCFLFVRKMMGSTLEPLLKIATTVLGF